MSFNLPYDYVQTPDCGYSFSFTAHENGVDSTLLSWITLDEGFHEITLQTDDVTLNTSHTTCIALEDFSCAAITHTIHYIATAD